MRDALAQATGHEVVVDNDAGVATLGEVTYGAAIGRRDVLLVTLGTGIGGGFLFDGRMYRGANNFGAEIGHFTVDPNGPLCACGERGHWESIASGSALGRMARELVAKGGGAALVAAAGGDPGAVTGTHVGTAAAQGDPDARGLLVQYAENVALGLAGLVNILDPECIVIAGGLVELGPLLFGPLREAFGRHVEGAGYRPAVDDRPRPARRAARVPSARPCSPGACCSDGPHRADAARRSSTIPRSRSRLRTPPKPRARRRVRLRPPVARRPARIGVPRSSASRCSGAVAAETTRLHVGTLVARAIAASAGHVGQLVRDRAAGRAAAA